MFEKFDFLALVVSEIWGGPKFTLAALHSPHAPSGKIFIFEKSTFPIEMCVEFQLSSSSSFPDMRGSQIYTRGAVPPARLLVKKISSWKEYFALSKCVQDFDFLALVVSEVWGGPKFTLGAVRPPHVP